MSKNILTKKPAGGFNTPLAVQIAAWSLSLGVCLIAIVAWGRDFNWQLFPISSYTLFPVLGLLAYSIMWSHYVAAAMRQFLNVDKSALSRYFETTSLAVLVLICLHPGLLVYQRFRDGFGLPLGSYESYVAPGLGWVTLLGTASLLVFLAYELRRIYGKRPWWHWVQKASDVAMIAIFYHGLRLGTQIHGWFRAVWWFYGLALIVVLAYSYYKKYQAGKVSPDK